MLRPASPLLALCLAFAGPACGSATVAPAEPSDRVPRQRTVDAYVEMLEVGDRTRWQMPDRVVEALAIEPGMTVADVGTGSGYFLPRLDAAVGEAGRVIAEDIDAELLERLRARVEREGLRRVEVRLGTPDDATLEPGTVDVVLMVDTFHHVVDPAALLASLRRALRPGGRVVIVDFEPGEHVPTSVSGHRHRVDPAEVERVAREAGLVVRRSHDFLPYQFILELAPPPP